VPRQVSAVLSRPSLTEHAASEILERVWGIHGALSGLPSERDRNFRVEVDDRPSFVLKFANLAEDREFLELQHRSLACLREAGLPVQQVVPATDGAELVESAIDGERTLARVLTWLPGVPLATVRPEARRQALLEDLGHTMGTVARSLATTDAGAARRSFQWDVLRFEDVVDVHARAVTDVARQRVLRRARERLGRTLVPVLGDLPRSLIHNDANDHNVLVDDAADRLTGLLDLGDMVESATANEAAVAAAYAMLGAPWPLDVLEAVARGFHAARPLARLEIVALPELVLARLCTSVVLSAHQARLDPADAYLSVSEGPAWDLLERLLAVDPAPAVSRLRGARR